MNEEYLKLPKHVMEIAVKTGNEYGWRQHDVLEVIDAAKNVSLATIGGQVQYVLPGGTGELYWLSYDSSERKEKENWLAYCDRSAFECSEKFKRLLKVDIEQDAIISFANTLTINGQPIDHLNDYQVFILYFNDEET